MIFLCQFLRVDRPLGDPVPIGAPDALMAAEEAAAKHADVAFTAVEIWEGHTRLLTWRRPTAEDEASQSFKRAVVAPAEQGKSSVV